MILKRRLLENLPGTLDYVPLVIRRNLIKNNLKALRIFRMSAVFEWFLLDFAPGCRA